MRPNYAAPAPRGVARRTAFRSLLWLMAAFLAAVGAATGAQPAQPKVRIVGYINVSSGCQTETVKFLRDFAAKHRRDVHLEIVDFGSAAGQRRWRADGYNCETIVINGSNQFVLGSGASARIVVLKMPEGVRWTFSDLAAVLAQELRAPRSTILSEAAAKKVAQRKPVAWQKGTWKGKPVGEVVVGAQTAFRFSGRFDGKSPVQRAQEAAAILKRLYANKAGVGDVRVLRGVTKEGSPVGAVALGDEIVGVVTEPEAEIINRPPQVAAQFWAFNLREALRLLGR